MAKSKTRTQFLCNSCGSVHLKWMGKCPDCGTWDGLEEYKPPTEDAHAARRAPRGVVSGANQTGDITRGAEPLTLDQIDEADSPRRPTGIGEFDRVLGGGIVPGSAVLVGGEPGIGKSTLLLQVAQATAAGQGGAGGGGGRGKGEEGEKGRSEEQPAGLPVSLAPALPLSPSLPPPRVL